jgi:hypothetical protein
MQPDKTGPAKTPPRHRRTAWAIVIVLVIGVAFLATTGRLTGRAIARPYPSRPLPPDSEPVLLPPPPVDDEYFPCDDCHEGEPADPRVRELDEHDYVELKHGDLWCLDCHDTDQRDLLHLSDASPVEMEESWRLCTRCHAKRIPDWRAGVHGKRTGNWWGHKEYRTCVVCHDPHAPLFKPIEPKPPPIPARDIRPRPRGGAPEVAHEGE